jgi:hypothetical protein
VIISMWSSETSAAALADGDHLLEVVKGVAAVDGIRVKALPRRAMDAVLVAVDAASDLLEIGGGQLTDFARVHFKLPG